MHIVINRYTVYQCCGSGLDPDSIGSLDPDPRASLLSIFLPHIEFFSDTCTNKREVTGTLTEN